MAIFLLNVHDKINYIENPCNFMYPRQNDRDWGMGVFFFPQFGIKIPIYDTKSLRHSGFIEYDDGLFKILDLNSKSQNNAIHRQEWIGSSHFPLLQVKNDTKDLLIINWKGPENYFGVQYSEYKIKKSELIKNGCIFFTYKQLLISKNLPPHLKWLKSWANMGINLTKNCLNLREQPSIASIKIFCVPGNDWSYQDLSTMQFIEARGDWAKFRVQLKKAVERSIDSEESECKYQIIKELTGWFKIVDENGFPNIWFSVTAY